MVSWCRGVVVKGMKVMGMERAWKGEVQALPQARCCCYHPFCRLGRQVRNARGSASIAAHAHCAEQNGFFTTSPGNSTINLGDMLKTNIENHFFF